MGSSAGGRRGEKRKVVGWRAEGKRKGEPGEKVEKVRRAGWGGERKRKVYVERV